MTSVSNFIKTSNLTINQCKVLIQNYYDKIYYLKSLSADEYLNISPEECSSLQSLQAGISEIHAQKVDIKRQLHKRKLKRSKIRRAKHKVRENLVNKRSDLDKQIDKNLEVLREETTAQLQKKEKIENINWKIKQLDKKIENSVNKQSIINGLLILRTLRENQSSASSEKNHQDAYSYFSSLQESLKAHISNLQIAKKLLLDSKMDPALESRYTPDLCEQLFGDRNYQANPLDRMSMDELIAARTYWDTFLVNDYDSDGSYIPKYWVGESNESD